MNFFLFLMIHWILPLPLDNKPKNFFILFGVGQLSSENLPLSLPNQNINFALTIFQAKNQPTQQLQSFGSQNRIQAYGFTTQEWSRWWIHQLKNKLKTTCSGRKPMAELLHILRNDAICRAQNLLSCLLRTSLPLSQRRELNSPIPSSIRFPR